MKIKSKPLPSFVEDFEEIMNNRLNDLGIFKRKIEGSWPKDESTKSTTDTNHVHLDGEISETVSTTTTEDMEGYVDWATLDGDRTNDVEYDGDTMPEDKFDRLFKAGLKASKRDIEAFASFLELREKGLTISQLMRKVVQVHPKAVSSIGPTETKGVTVVNIIKDPKTGLILYRLYIDTDTDALINMDTPSIKHVMGKPQQVLTTVLHKLAGYNIKIKEVE